MSRVMRTAVVVDYPCSDDRPMAESESQLCAMLYLLTVLRAHFCDRADVYVIGDMFMYYEEGNSAAVVAPDVMVVVGAPKREENPRDSYKLWEEPKGPDFVLEIASRSTWIMDRDEKRALYASLGVSEYWLFDPTGERIASRLHGMRLVGGRYLDLPPEALEPGSDRGASLLDARTVHSGVLGLDVRVERDGTLSVCDPVTGEMYVGYAEERAARLTAEAARRTETAARMAAEAQVAELQARLRELRGGDPPPGDDTPA